MNPTDKSIVSVLAQQIRSAYASGKPIAPLREQVGADPAAAYAVQEANTAHWLAEGRRLVGRKIGLTSAAVQKQLGVDQPDYGMLYADMAVPDGFEISRSRLIQPRVEAEVAFVLARDLDNERLTAADVIRAIDFVVPALEIVDSRIADWNIRITDTVADNASSGLYVIGNEPRALTGLDLRNCKMKMECGGEVVSSGAGHACLGHPVNALLWLGQVMSKVGRPLRAGDTVLSGALGPMVAVRWGTAFEAQIDGLGTVRAVFGPATT